MTLYDYAQGDGEGERLGGRATKKFLADDETYFLGTGGESGDVKGYDNTVTVKCAMPEGKKDGEKVWITYEFIGYRALTAYTVYTYQWHSGKAPEESQPESGGYWEFVKSGDINPSDPDEFSNQYALVEISASSGSFHYKLTHRGGDFKQYYKPPNHPNCDGEYVEQSITVSSPAKYFKPGEMISLSMNSSVSHTEHMPDVPAMLSARFTEYEPKDGIPGGGIKLKTDRDYHDTNYGLGGTNIGFEVVPGGGYIMEGSDRVECNGFKGTIFWFTRRDKKKAQPAGASADQRGTGTPEIPADFTAPSGTVNFTPPQIPNPPPAPQKPASPAPRTATPKNAAPIPTMPKPTVGKFCTECGAPLKEGAKYCTECGKQCS